MRLHYILFFLLVQISYSQISEADRADKLASQEKYSDEITLRTAILASISDQNSEFYKEQQYKLKLAEYHSSKDIYKALSKLLEADEIFNTLKIQDPLTKIEIDLEHYAVLNELEDYEASLNKLLQIREFTSQQTTSPEIEKHLAAILLQIGRSQLYFHEYDKSIASLYEALEKNMEIYGYNSMETADVYKELSAAYSYTDNLQAKLDNTDKALEIYETIQPKDLSILFKQYADAYQGYMYYGDAAKVKEYYKKITDYYNAHKLTSSFINAKHPEYRSLNAINSTYYYVQLQHATAFSDVEKAEEIFLKFKNELLKPDVKYNSYEMGSIMSYYLQTGSMFHKLEDHEKAENYTKAKQYYLDGLRISRKNDYEFGELQAYMMLSILGVDYKRWEDVITYTEMAFKKPDIEKFNQIQTLKHNLGLAYGGMKEYAKAMALLDEEYEFYLKDEINHYYTITNLTESGNLYLDLYEDDPNPEFLEKAYRNFSLSSEIFSRLYRGGEFSVRLQWYLSRINNGLLLSASKLGENRIEVVEQLEKNHSDYLWSSFLKNRKEPFSESSMKLQVQLDSLKLRQKSLALQINNDTLKPKEIESLRSKLKATEKIYNQTEREFIKVDNSFFQFSRTDFDLKKLQKGIKKNELIVKYVVTDFSAFAYTIGPREVKLIQLKKTGLELKALVSEYLTALKSINPEFLSLSKSLYIDLIAPLSLERNSKLIIVPDGFLSNLPFETLSATDAKYLVEDHAISYAYSLKLFDIQKNIKESSKSVLAVFSPDYDLNVANSSDQEDLKHLVRSGNYELLGAKAEAQNISSIFGGDLFLGNMATKSNFMEKYSDYDILHLAMHAIVNEEDSDMSSLIFNNDERLYLSELYDMKIPAHLAVLSACDTGSGELKEGEGVQSLSRAFTYAGVKSTVMSLWPVPDRETSVIMTEFYNNLKAGKSKDEALQLAKVDYLKNVSEVEFKHPYYWAGFIVSGDVAPLQSGLSFWWYIGIAVIILLLLFWYLKRKRYL